MAIVPGATKKRRGLEEDDDLLDRISLLPDGVLGDIVSLLPTSDGARTQVLSSRWRRIWRSAPLNFAVDYLNPDAVTANLISHILSTHQGPGRRFSIPKVYPLDTGLRAELFITNLDCWLKSPSLDQLQELEFHYYDYTASAWYLEQRPPPPKSLNRFSSTLHVATFGGCSFGDGDNAGGLQFLVLRRLSLSDVRFSESSLRAFLAACPVLQSLLLTSTGMMGCSTMRIACPTLRSIGVKFRSNFEPDNLQLLIIEAPCLERLLSSDYCCTDITVISAPKLHVLGQLTDDSPRLKFGTTVIQGSVGFISLKMLVHSVKVLSLKQERLSLDRIIEFMKCFPYLEKLYIQTIMTGEKIVWCDKYKNLIGTLDIRLKTIVLTGYRGSVSHANFARFFVLGARMLQSMRLELPVADRVPIDAWIDRQHRLLHIKNKASRDMQLDFTNVFTFSSFCPEHVHDLSRPDPFS